MRVNVSMIRVLRCSRYVNAGRMDVILNGESLKEMNCFEYMGSQVAVNGGC